MLILAQLPQLCPWAASYHPLLLAFKGKGVQGSCPAARGVIWYQLWFYFYMVLAAAGEHNTYGLLGERLI